VASSVSARGAEQLGFLVGWLVWSYIFVGVLVLLRALSVRTWLARFAALDEGGGLHLALLRDLCGWLAPFGSSIR